MIEYVAVPIDQLKGFQTALQESLDALPADIYMEYGPYVKSAINDLQKLIEAPPMQLTAWETYKGDLLHDGDPKVSQHSNPEPLYSVKKMYVYR